MKAAGRHGLTWREPPKLTLPKIEELFGITEFGKGLIGLVVVGLILVALIAAFVYSASPTTVRIP